MNKSPGFDKIIVLIMKDEFSEKKVQKKYLINGKKPPPFVIVGEAVPWDP